jgi:hypothetical protein
MRKANLKNVVYVVALLGALAFLWRTLQGTPRAATRGANKKSSAQETQTGGRDASASRRVQAAPNDAELKRYQVIVARNIFAPPAPPTPKVTTPTAVPELFRKTVLIAPTGPPPPYVPQPTSLTGWEYAGYFAVDGAKKGVLQNKNSTSAKFLGTGEEFQGWRVESISGEQIVLAAGATRTTLERPRDFPVVPLEGMTAQAPRAGAGGAPGGGGMRGRGGGG